VKTAIRSAYLVAVMVVPLALSAGEQPFPCLPSYEKDPRPEIRIFCHDLSQFQHDVTFNKALTTEELRHKFTPDLDQFDLSDPSSTYKFISSVAISNSAKTAAAGATSALQDAGQARPDRQLSAPNNANGTTSLVSKAGSAELLSLALDSGALTQSVNGTTTTLSTNADQLFRLVTDSDPDCTVTCSGGWFEDKILSPTTILATLNLAQPSSKNVMTSGQASGTNATPVGSATLPTSVGTLSGITARYEILNKFDPRTEEFKTAWYNAVDTGTLPTVNKVLGDRTDAVRKILNAKATPLDDDRRAQMVEAARKDPSGKALAEFFAAYFLNASDKVMQDPDIAGDEAQVMQQRAIYRQAWFEALHNAVGNLLTIEYNYNHPTNQPSTSVVKLIYAYNFGNTGMLTFNGAVSLYNGALPAGAKYGQLYYGQLSTQYDRTITGQNSGLQTQLSLAGYWQYQPHPSVLNIAAGTVAPGTDIPLPNGTQEFVGTAGSLWVTQAKLTVKAKGGISVPIGVSWSNKTDLLQGNKIGAQVGLSYNFSSVAGLFKGGSQ
jgi:hypothetical protein